MPPVTTATVMKETKSLTTVASFADLIAMSTQQQRLLLIEAKTPETNPAANIIIMP